MIKKTFFQLVIFLCLYFVATYTVCKSTDTPFQLKTEDGSLDKLKELANFYNWPGKKGRVRDGINLSRFTLPSLSGMVEIPQEISFSYLELEDGKILIKYRSRWQETPDNFIEISLIFAETCDQAHEYVISRFFNSSLPFELRVPKRDDPLIAGDISFSGGRRFIRNNIYVEIRPVGEMEDKIAAVAKDIDDLLLTRTTASSAEQFKPMIRRFEIINHNVEHNSQTRFIIDVVDPQGSDLYYFWRLTSGGIIKDEFGNWYYHAAADPGTNQTITLIVINERGYYSSSSITVNIKL